MTDSKPLIYLTLMGSISTESKNIISQSARYLDHCDKNKDSDELAILVGKTHYTEVSCDNPLRKYNTNAKVEMRSPKSGDITRCVNVVDNLGFPQLCMDKLNVFTDKAMSFVMYC